MHDEGTRSEKKWTSRAHVTSIRLRIAFRDTRSYGLVNRPVFEHELLNFGESCRYLNFKSANVYFCPGPAVVPRSLFLFLSPYRFLYLSICLPFPVIGQLFPDALNFKFCATAMSATAATTDFRVFPPAYALSFVSVALRPGIYVQTHRDLRHGISGVPHFYLWRHPVCIRIDSVIYSAVDSAGPLYNTTREGEFRRPRFDHLSLRRCVRPNDYAL